MIDYIDANTFADFAHFRLNPNFPGDHVQWNPEIIKQNSIVFVKKGLTDMFFNNVRNSMFTHIMITHLSDDPINEYEFNKKPVCVTKWFAENACYDHPDLIPIPFGLENHFGICTEGHPGRFKHFTENLEKFKENPKNTDTVYCNWSIANNVGERSGIMEKLKVKYYWEHGIHFNQYYDNSSHYKFIISPPGNGVDAQRQWEAIYMDCIPIVIKHNIYKEYNDLPLIQVNDWDEVTYDLLNSYLNKEFNYEKVTMTYWKKRLMNEFDKL